MESAMLPSGFEQRDQIKFLLQEHGRRPGDEYFLVSVLWWNIWKESVAFDGGMGNGELPGPIHNAELLDEKGHLKEALLEETHYILLPERAWKLIHSWYGGGPAISRRVIVVGVMEDTMVEVYPLRLRLLMPNCVEGYYPIRISRSATIKELVNLVASRLYLPPSKVLLRYANVSLAELNREDIWTPVDKSMYNEALDLYEIADEAFLFACSISDDAKNHIPSVPSPISFSPDSYVLESAEDEIDEVDMDESSDEPDSQQSDFIPFQFQQEALATDGTPSYSTYNTRSTVTTTTGFGKSGVTGITGLVNLGNTCFMNCALQCLSHTQQLTPYFVQDEYLKELNRDNPLGTSGKLAEEYGKLLKRMWNDSYASISPGDFKWTLSRFAPQFSGYRQHDAQELLGYLLDGLHEDLNRVIDKPYTEPIEHNGRSDAIVALESWENHLKRNRSVIVDVFQGQLKSTVVCPEPSCANVSVTFDPFMYLSLPLPQPTHKSVTVFYYPYNKQEAAVKVRVPRNGAVSNLVEAVAAQVTGESVDNVIVTRVSNHDVTAVLGFQDPIPNLSMSMDSICLLQRKTPSNGGSDCSYNDLAIVASIPIIVCHRSGGPPISDPVGYPVVVDLPVNHSREISVLDALSTILETLRIGGRRNLSDLESIMKLSRRIEGTSGTVPIPYDDSTIRPVPLERWYLTWSDARFHTSSVGIRPLTRLENGSNDFGRNDETLTLADCLHAFTSPEKLGKEDEWYCPKCKCFRQATKKFDLWLLPRVLVIHLKRFHYSQYSRNKISTMVDYPLDNLNLGSYVKGPNKSCKYRLFAVAEHSGGLGGGHYTSHVYNRSDHRWHFFNDDVVRPSTPQDACNPNAYLLFYERVDE